MAFNEAVRDFLIRRVFFPGATPYSGQTYGLGRAGVPVYSANLPESAGAIKPPWMQAVVVNRRVPLSEPSAAHEMKHVQQEQVGGVKVPVVMAIHQLLALLQGRDPRRDTPEEQEAYAAENVVNQVPPEVPDQIRQFFLDQARSRAMGNR